MADFNSEDPQTCRPSDVPLNAARAQVFFRRARQVDYRVIHDHYDVGPCYVEGTLVYGGKACEWRIRAGATGYIRCEGRRRDFACDTCDDLFQAP